MNKQSEVILIRIDEELKKQFKNKCDKNYQTLSARIKAFILNDVNGKLIMNKDE